MPQWALIAAITAYFLMSAITIIAYWIDKRRAIKGAWRTKERTLHLLALAFGWPGALLAQRALRHKRRKAQFVAVTWTTAVIHVLAWIGLWWVMRNP